MATIDNVTFVQRLIATSWDAINDGEIEENVYDMRRSLDVLSTRGKRFLRKDQAGSMLEANVEVQKLAITQQLVEGGSYNLNNIEPYRGAKWPWVLTNSALVFTFEEIGENQGRPQLINIVKQKTLTAMQDHFDGKNVQFVRGTGTVPSSESLDTLIGTSDNGGLSVATFSTWKGYVDTASQALTQDIIDKAIDGTMFTESQGIDFILSGPTLFQRYKSKGATATTLFMPSDQKKPNTAYTGIEYVTFRDAVWTWDRQIPDVANTSLGDTTNYLYGVDSSKLFCAAIKGAWNAPLEKKESINQLMHHIPIVSRYQFGTTSRRSHFKLTTVTTA